MDTCSKLVDMHQQKFNSFIHSGYLYSTPSRNLHRGALSPVMVKEKCLKKLAEGRHIVPGQQTQHKREFDRSMVLMLQINIVYCKNTNPPVSKQKNIASSLVLNRWYC